MNELNSNSNKVKIVGFIWISLRVIKKIIRIVNEIWSICLPLTICKITPANCVFEYPNIYSIEIRSEASRKKIKCTRKMFNTHIEKFAYEPCFLSLSHSFAVALILLFLLDAAAAAAFFSISVRLDIFSI